MRVVAKRPCTTLPYLVGIESEGAEEAIVALAGAGRAISAGGAVLVLAVVGSVGIGGLDQQPAGLTRRAIRLYNPRVERICAGDVTGPAWRAGGRRVINLSKLIKPAHKSDCILLLEMSLHSLQVDMLQATGHTT